MKKSAVFLLFIIFQTAGFEIPSDHKMLADRITSDILHSRFEKAVSRSDSAFVHDPQNAMASVLHLVALGMRDVDFDSTVDTAAFLASFDRAKKAVSEYEKSNGVSSYSKMLQGFTLAIHASFYLKTKEYFAAYGTGIDAIKLMKEARELDSTNTEVNFFLGLYDYARGDLKKKLWWALFWFPGNKASGIRQLEQAAKSASITGTASRLALCDIYLQQKKSPKSQALLNQLEKEIPQSRYLLWAKAKYHEELEQYTEAAEVYGTLAASYEKEPLGFYNSIVTRNKQAHLYHEAGEKQLAKNICKIVLERPAEKRTRALHKDTEKLLEKLNDKS